MIPVVLFLLCIVAASYAAPDHAAHHEQVNTVLGGFLPIRPALPGSPVKLLFALPPSNMEGLHAALQEISDPRSSNYGQYLSKNQVRIPFIPHSSRSPPYPPRSRHLSHQKRRVSKLYRTGWQTAIFLPWRPLPLGTCYVPTFQWNLPTHYSAPITPNSCIQRQTPRPSAHYLTRSLRLYKSIFLSYTPPHSMCSASLRFFPLTCSWHLHY